MSSLALRLQKRLDVATTMGAVATLQRIADSNGEAVRGERLDVLVPANNNLDIANNIEVASGRWLVEATLPSGEVITEEVEVPEGQEVVPVTLHTKEQPPEPWLAWQHLMGNIEGAETLKFMRERAREAALRLAQEALGKKADPKLIARIGDYAATATELLWRKMRPTIKALHNVLKSGHRAISARSNEAVSNEIRTDLPSASSTEDSGPATRLGAPIVSVSQMRMGISDNATAWTDLWSGRPTGVVHAPFMNSDTEETWTYQFDRPVPPGGGNQSLQLAPREFVDIAWAGERYVVSLPLPWPTIAQSRPVSAEILVRMRPLEQRVQIGVAVQDETFGPLSGLMTASTLTKAAVAVRQAQEMLFFKTKIPLAAAAGGYILLAAGDPKQTDWHGWIDNFEALYPGLPDGAVLKGSLLTRYPKDERSSDAAREAFLRAYDRGIPYFSAGVAWLLDGLTLFEGDDGVNERLTHVHRVAQRLDLTQAFTTIRISDRIKR